MLEAAARFLEARPRSVSEVRRRLTSAGFRPELVAGAVERMVELGFLDDEAFARAWVESRDRARPRSERALREELRLKGIDRVVIDAVLADRATQGGGRPDDEAAERLLTKHARALARFADPRQRRQRAYALLARNGFPPDVCARVAASVVGGSAGDAVAAVEDAVAAAEADGP